MVPGWIQLGVEPGASCGWGESAGELKAEACWGRFDDVGERGVPVKRMSSLLM